MGEENLAALERIIMRKSTELGLYHAKQSPKILSLAAPHERFHLMLELSSPVAPPLPLQMSIQDEGDTIRALLFPSPRILTEQTAECFLGLANEANRELYRGTALGRFWVDIENLDFAYELILKEFMLKNSAKEIAVQIFDVPLAHFRDLHIPLVMLAEGGWAPDVALQYLRQLRRDGYVDNRDYGL